MLVIKKAQDEEIQITKLTGDIGTALEFIETGDAEKDDALRVELIAHGDYD